MRSRNWIKEDFLRQTFLLARSFYWRKNCFHKLIHVWEAIESEAGFSKLMKVARVENLLKDISSYIQSDEMMIRKRSMSWN